MRDFSIPEGTDAWLNGLAGRRPEPADRAEAAGLAEGRLLREALRRWPVTAPALDPVVDQARLDALLAAAHADRRTAAHAGCTTCQALRDWWASRRWAGAAVLAAVVLMTWTLTPWTYRTTPPKPPADVLRGTGTGGVQRLHAADPSALRRQIVDELARIGVAATPYERQGRFGLDGELPAARSAEWSAVLRRHGIEPPTNGELAVEIEARP